MTQQGMSTKSRHLTIPDLITIGVFTALYFVLVAVATLFSSVALMGFGMILLPAVAALICGCVYMLLVAKVGKFGAISVMGIVVGLFLFVSGHFILSLAASIVFPVIADAIARAGDYRSRYPGELCRVLLWADRSDSAVVVHEGCLCGQSAGPWQGLVLYRWCVRTCQYRHVFHCHDSGTGMCVARRLVWAAYAEEAFCEDRHHLMALDPRTKLYLVALANLLLFFHVDVVVESLTVLLLLLPLLGAGRWAAAVRFGCIYVLLLVGTWASTLDDGGSWLHMLGLLCVGIRMMMPCLIAGIYAFTTTTASQFVCALRRMRIPETIVIPCVVCIRFFPTIHDDYHQIRDAMALRGIAQGTFALLRHPAQSLEYILMPLLMNATGVAQDLSVAALTKGIGIRGPHTCHTEIRMHGIDWAWMVICTVPLALGIGGAW